MSEKFPNFFVVGAPKAGTTALHGLLDQHPQIFMSPLKETHFFATEFRIDNFKQESRRKVAQEMRNLENYFNSKERPGRFGGLVTRSEDYLSLFREVRDEVAIGEATPVYLWSPSAAKNIAAQVPHAKIIMILRNPIERAFSQYLHMASVRRVRSFRTEIDASLRCRSRLIGQAWSLLEFGRYSEQVQRYLDHFPGSRVHVALYEDLVRDPSELLCELFGFLEVDPLFVPDFSVRRNEPRVLSYPGITSAIRKLRVWNVLRQLLPAKLVLRLRSMSVVPRNSLVIEPEDRAVLAEYYRADIQELGKILGRDLTHWLAD